MQGARGRPGKEGQGTPREGTSDGGGGGGTSDGGMGTAGGGMCVLTAEMARSSTSQQQAVHGANVRISSLESRQSVYDRLKEAFR